MGKLEFGTALKQRRKQLRITQGQLAAYASLSINTVYQIERGQANPTLDTLLTLVDTLGLELDLRTKTLNP